MEELINNAFDTNHRSMLALFSTNTPTLLDESFLPSHFPCFIGLNPSFLMQQQAIQVSPHIPNLVSASLTY